MERGIVMLPLFAIMLIITSATTLFATRNSNGVYRQPRQIELALCMKPALEL